METHPQDQSVETYASIMPQTQSGQGRHWVAPGTSYLCQEKVPPKKCHLDSELGKEFLKDAQRQEAGEEAAAEAADDREERHRTPSTESLGPEPPQGSTELSTPEPWSVSRSPDYAPAETFAIPLLLVTFAIHPCSEAWL